VFLEGLKEFGTQFYITSISGEDARIYPLSVWSEIEDRLAAMPSQHEGKRKFLLRTSYYGQQVEVDGQGRLLLPGVLRESAQLKAEVDVFGELNILVVMNHTGLVDKMKNEPLTGDELTALGV
jgi:MraZ protein